MTTSANDEFLNELSDSVDRCVKSTSVEASTSGAYESSLGALEPKMPGNQDAEGDVEVAPVDQEGPNAPVVMEGPLDWVVSGPLRYVSHFIEYPNEIFTSLDLEMDREDAEE